MASACDVLDQVLRGASNLLYHDYIVLVHTASLKLIPAFLRFFCVHPLDEFGYKHILWVFSGRRGIHCWVSDSAAMALTDESRKALVSYLELVKGGTGVDKRVTTRYGRSTAPIHPMLGEALDRLTERFTDLILEDQDCFKTKEGWEKLLKLLPTDEAGE